MTVQTKRLLSDPHCV